MLLQQLSQQICQANHLEVLKSFCKYDALSYYTSDYMTFILFSSVLGHAARRETEPLPLVCGGQEDA